MLEATDWAGHGLAIRCAACVEKRFECFQPSLAPATLTTGARIWCEVQLLCVGDVARLDAEGWQADRWQDSCPCHERIPPPRPAIARPQATYDAGLTLLVPRYPVRPAPRGNPFVSLKRPVVPGFLVRPECRDAMRRLKFRKDLGYIASAYDKRLAQ